MVLLAQPSPELQTHPETTLKHSAVKTGEKNSYCSTDVGVRIQLDTRTHFIHPLCVLSILLTTAPALAGDFWLVKLF